MIEEVLPNAMFRVRLDDNRTVLTSVSTSLKHVIVRLISGSQVEVKLSSHDQNRGHIIKKL